MTRSNSTSTARRYRGRFERLEDRLALDAGGVLTGVDPHFTLSFAPDGTEIGAAPSTLNARLDALAPNAAWREAVLTAFQTWAVHTNADIAVVADGGQAFGTPGATQHDERFGDIRIGATALSPEVGAVSVPIDNAAPGTWWADVVVNSSFNYASVDDVLAVLTHEAGNVFGLKDSTDPNSPLYFGEAPVVHPPTAADIAALQALHGVRAPDALEESGPGGATDNDSLANAASLDLARVDEASEGSAPTIAFGDLHNAADVDYFKIDAPGDYTGAMTVRLRTSGVSLLQPSLAVLDSTGQPLSQASSTELGGSLLTISLPISPEQDAFVFRVDGAAPGVFEVGGYSLAVTFDSLNTVDAAVIDELTSGRYRTLSTEDLRDLFDNNDSDDFFGEDGGSNETPGASTELSTSTGFVDSTRYDVLGSIAGPTDVDYYSIKSPKAAVGPLGAMFLSVRSLSAGGLIPQVEVLDDNQARVPTQVIANGGGLLVVQVTGVAANKEYFVSVSPAGDAGPFTEGNYDLTITFAADPATVTEVGAGTVGAENGVQEHTLYIGEPQLFHFGLAAAAVPTTAPTSVIAVIKDANGEAQATVAAPLGDTRTAPAVLLAPGTYSIEVFAASLSSGTLPEITYSLISRTLSDPFVGDPSDPTSHPFACPDPELAGFYCYPGDFLSADPYLWDDFVGSLPDEPTLPLTELVNLLLGDWWSWVWAQAGANGPILTQDDRFDILATPSPSEAAAAEGVFNVLANDIDPEGMEFVAVLGEGPQHGTLQLDPNGEVHYTPDAGYVGSDSFTYSALDFQQNATPGTAYLVVGSGITGDYTGDGVVDQADSALWRASYGSTTDLVADGNRDMVVNSADYTGWREAFAAAQQTAPTVEAIAAPVLTFTTATPPQPDTAAAAAPFDGASLQGTSLQPRRSTRRPAKLLADPFPAEHDAALALLYTDASRAISTPTRPTDPTTTPDAGEPATEPGQRPLLSPVRARWQSFT
ncbi:hypothetical protein Pla123a_30460 [Posidoniimonas polymericola]|uniref:Matrixin n=1 Tax=Posidoniimonas polymericola TaxID=2528002 RepID=A0A5C5YKY2_9BACT|nr:Ig-like domain-containing protein [Posidoniimonas polymericola]TWT75536.1 hypothetical protein Pla123a_30460 [Posidoniimonas polymericola]